jgi:WD40 repeat protein
MQNLFIARPIDISSLVVSSIHASCNMHHIAIAGFWDSTIKVYSLNGGGFVQSLSKHKEIATCIAFSKRGKVLVSGGRDTTVCIYEMATDASCYVYKRTLYGHSTPLISVDVNEDVGAVVSCSVFPNFN